MKYPIDKVLYTIMFIILIIPLVKPIGLPLPVSAMTQQFYDYLVNIPKGSTVLLISSALVLATQYGDLNIFKFCRAHEIKLVYVATNTVTPGYVSENFKDLNIFSWTDYVYGRDWVYLGYIVMAETALQQLRDDFKSIATVDYQGTPITSLELTKNIKDISSFSAVIFSHWTGEMAARQLPGTPTRPLLMIHDMYGYPDLIPYYPQTINALLVGLGAIGEFESLTRQPGKAIASTDAVSLATIFILCVLAYANYDSYKKRQKKVVVEEKGGVTQ